MLYKYTGKPSTTQRVHKSYTAVTNARYTPSKNGLLLSMIYLNGTAEAAGKVRVRVIRERPNDASAYQDFYVPKGNFLITHVWFEACERGRPLHWEVKSDAPLKLTTRYSKCAVL